MKVLVYYGQFINSSQTTVQEYKHGYKDTEEEIRITAQEKSST